MQVDKKFHFVHVKYLSQLSRTYWISNNSKTHIGTHGSHEKSANCVNLLCVFFFFFFFWGGGGGGGGGGAP